MIEYYTMPDQMELFDECLKNGINTFQSRGDRHQMRDVPRAPPGRRQIQWIAQTASEFRSIEGNIDEIARYKPIAIYHHGTHTDNSWHTGKIDEVRDLLKAIHDQGLPAGIGTHIPEVIEYAEEKGWETDFYMGCFYNLARSYKAAPAAERNAYAQDRFPAEDPARMTADAPPGRQALHRLQAHGRQPQLHDARIHPRGLRVRVRQPQAHRHGRRRHVPEAQEPGRRKRRDGARDPCRRAGEVGSPGTERSSPPGVYSTGPPSPRLHTTGLEPCHVRGAGKA